ncbi:hypothetical protein AB0N05_18710 [Nocardia sp. NPDC051030]|uniref:hypothetical protein n=1 Tax=Nocardia sp. NPDC051030 TaxID=3155162 RepID=UPI003440C3EC
MTPAPPRIQITGRARSGKSTVRNALSLISAEETLPVDDPAHPDPVFDADLYLYVLPGTLHPADRRILATLPSTRTLVILNKADAIGTHWSDAATAAESHTETLALPVFPLVGSMAARTRTTTVTPEDLATLHNHLHHPDPPLTLSADLFTSPTLSPDAQARQSLLTRWPLYGISCALVALRRDPSLSSAALLQILHGATGIDPLHQHLYRLYQQVTASPQP